MRFFDQFGIAPKQIGKLRREFIKWVERHLGSVLKYRAASVPLVMEEERYHGFYKLWSPTQIERVKERFLIFSADMDGHSFKHLVGFLYPIYLEGRKFLEEYTYTTVLPYPVDSSIAFLEKWVLVHIPTGWDSVTGKPPRVVLPGEWYEESRVKYHPVVTRFFSVSPDSHSLQITEEELFKGQDSHAFEVTQELRQKRVDLWSLFKPHPIRIRQPSPFCESLNAYKGLRKQVRKLKALSDKKPKFTSVWVSALLVPMDDSIIVQVGDLRLNPKLAMNTLEVISEALKAANTHYK